MKTSNQRTAYGEALRELGAEFPNIVVCEADLGRSTMSALFGDQYPDRYFEMGIAEANMTSFAAGLSLTGKIAFTNSFAVFSGGRAYDQIRQSVSIGSLNVKVMGSSSGLSDFGDGATHQAIEDISLMRGIPNMTVLVPCDAIETRKMIRAMVLHDGPCFIRTCRNDLPEIYPENEEFVIGAPRVMREGSDVVVFAFGVMVARALQAAEELQGKGVSVRVVNVSTLKPLNNQILRDLSRGVRGVVTAEEHSLIGGLGAAACYALRGMAVPIECIGVEDRFGQSAQTYEELLVEYGLTSEHVKALVLKTLGK